MSILTIDIGDKHTSICEWNAKLKKYRIYLFSVDSKQAYSKKTKEIRQHMDAIFEQLTKPIKKIYIEKQMVRATNNIRAECFMMMYLSFKQDEEKFMFMEQSGKDKYKRFGSHKDLNMKTVGSQYIAKEYIDKNLVEICYQQGFGKGGCKRKKDGSVRRCKWYSDSTYAFCKKYDLDKLDDVSDTILMSLAARHV